MGVATPGCVPKLPCHQHQCHTGQDLRRQDPAIRSADHQHVHGPPCTISNIVVNCGQFSSANGMWTQAHASPTMGAPCIQASQGITFTYDENSVKPWGRHRHVLWMGVDQLIVKDAHLAESYLSSILLSELVPGSHMRLQIWSTWSVLYHADPDPRGHRRLSLCSLYREGTACMSKWALYIWCKSLGIFSWHTGFHDRWRALKNISGMSLST